MNEQAVKTLTRKGCIVHREAAELLTNEDVDRIDSLDTPPMYLSEKLLESLRGQDHDLEPDTERVVFSTSCPEFMGIDMTPYGPFEEGDTAELPEDNAIILENRAQVKIKHGDEA